MRPRLLRKRYFLWLAVPAAIYGIQSAYGLPHLRVSYTWIDQGQGYDPFADRYYTHCVFVGPFGRFDFYPSDGSCAWIRFYTRQKTAGRPAAIERALP